MFYLRSRRLPIYPRSGYLCASDGDANKAVITGPFFEKVIGGCDAECFANAS